VNPNLAPAIEHVAVVYDMRARFEGLPSVLARRHEAARRVERIESRAQFSLVCALSANETTGISERVERSGSGAKHGDRQLIHQHAQLVLYRRRGFHGDP
jgi:hypothetical protein